MGHLFICEGIDGSGKSTQTALLRTRLESEGKEVVQLKFPQYGQPYCAPVEMYLHGDFGSDPGDVNAYAASSFYAVDRYASYKLLWGRDYEAGKMIVSDRYVTSNLIHQGSKLAPEERLDYYRWLYDFEFDKLGLPRPNAVFFLDVSPDVSGKQLLNRYAGDETKKDIHERDEAYLWKCYDAAMFACEHGYMTPVTCVENGQMLAREAISERLYDLVKGEL